MLMLKKGAMGTVVNIFILLLVIVVIAGMTFLFTAQLKNQISEIAGEDSAAFQAVNDTEHAGTAVVGYLPLIILALIFSALLVLVLKIILPYINVGNSMGGI